ncbi:hypothetical protein BDZ45DRAFT_668849 [Acephala macrosclerotiorum]|nr:hypothetical protein BDZ45DRAFT_668849 [Acephala macrosclerotiorum]
MGCKYKHEMPTDKATQLSLGLNHGLPNWYRRAYAVPSHARTEGSWRHRNQAQLEAAPSIGNSTPGSGGQSIFKLLAVDHMVLLPPPPVPKLLLTTPTRL